MARAHRCVAALRMCAPGALRGCFVRHAPYCADGLRQCECWLRFVICFVVNTLLFAGGVWKVRGPEELGKQS